MRCQHFYVAAFHWILLLLGCLLIFSAGIQFFGNQHAYKQAAEPNNVNGNCEDGKLHDGGPRTQSSNPPAQPKAGGSKNQFPVYVSSFGVEELCAEVGFFSTFYHIRKGNEVEEDSAT